MKKILSLFVIGLMALTLQAQRCAVLEFRAGSGISQSDVDGISAIFITYFRPAGYTLVERTQIDKAIEEQGFQRSRMTESQMVRIGEILNVSKIVIGDVNVVMGQYNVDARVINVESGTIAAAKGATFNGSSYRSTMQSLAQSLASSIAITSGGTVYSSQGNQQQRTEPYIIYGYLKVFPQDLGTFNQKPSSLINTLNRNQQYGYASWRLPNEEELAILRANGIISGENYMTMNSDGGGKVRLVTEKEKGETIREVPDGYVDLGLPSGTLWAKTWTKLSEDISPYDACQTYIDKLPSKEQFEELIKHCQWKWQNGGYLVTGNNNGASIFLPVYHYKTSWRTGNTYQAEYTKYWSSTRDTGQDILYYLDLDKDNYKIEYTGISNTYRRGYGFPEGCIIFVK